MNDDEEISSEDFPNTDENLEDADVSLNIEEKITDDDDLFESSSLRKRKKRRFVDRMQWKFSANKKREEEQEYLGRRNNDFSVKRNKKSLKERCVCNNKSGSALKCSLLEEKDRDKLFKRFWNLSWNEKKTFICASVSKQDIKRAINRKNEDESRRTCTYSYFLEKNFQKLRVCKMFCNTLAIPNRTVSAWISSEIVKLSKPNVNQRETEKQKANENNRSLKNTTAKKSLRQFLESIPKLESYYCRKSSSKLYLQPQFKNKSELYNFYKEDWCVTRDEKPLSIASFCYMFEDMNLALFSPKKDECDTCVGYRTKNIAEQKYQEHIQKKEEARQAKEKDKNSENPVFTMDLQSVLLCPKCNVSAICIILPDETYCAQFYNF